MELSVLLTLSFLCYPSLLHHQKLRLQYSCSLILTETPHHRLQIMLGSKTQDWLMHGKHMEKSHFTKNKKQKNRTKNKKLPQSHIGRISVGWLGWILNIWQLGHGTWQNAAGIQYSSDKQAGVAGVLNLHQRTFFVERLIDPTFLLCSRCWIWQVYSILVRFLLWDSNLWIALSSESEFGKAPIHAYRFYL